MAANSPLEEMRELFKDPTVHIAIGKIDKIEIAQDRSVVRCLVSIFPENRQIVTRMTWEAVGPDSGIFMLPAVDDMVLVAIAEGEEDQAFIIKRLTSRIDKVPLQAKDGHLFLRPINGKKAYLASDTKILLSKGNGADPTENIPLGQELKAMLQELITEVKNHTHMGNLGAQTSKPLNESAMEAIKAGKVDNEKILSKLAFVEK